MSSQSNLKKKTETETKLVQFVQTNTLSVDDTFNI